MKKKRFWLVVILILLISPVISADNGGPSLTLGMQTIAGWLQDADVQIVVMLLLLALFLYSAIAASTKHIPLFKGSPEQEKLGRIAALTITGIILIGTFFYRTNAYNSFMWFASVMPWFFSALFSLIIALALRQMLAAQKFKTAPFGVKVETIAAWIAGWGLLYLFANAQGDLPLAIIAATALTVGSVLFLLAGDWYSKQDDVRRRRWMRDVIVDTRDASRDTQRASQSAAAAQAEAAGAAQHMQAAATEAEAAGDVSAPATPEERTEAFEHVDESVHEQQEAGKTEIKAVLDVENALSKLREAHDILKDRANVLAGMLRSLPSEKRKPEWNRTARNALDIEQSLENELPKLEQSKEQLKAALLANLDELNKASKKIERREEKLKDKKIPEPFKQQMRQQIEKHENIRAGLIRRNQKLITSLGILIVEIDKYASAVKRILDKGVPDIKEMIMEYTEEAEESGVAAKSIYDIALYSGNSKQSGEALTKLTQLDRQGLFEGKTNYFINAVNKLAGSNVKYYEGGQEKFAIIAVYGPVPAVRSEHVRGHLPLTFPSGERYPLKLQNNHRLEITKA